MNGTLKTSSNTSDNPSEKRGLRTLTLKDEYNTEDDDVIKDLYAPCLKASKQYDRAVGYFRASIYRELGEHLLDFVIHGGKVRLVCSPDIPEPDETAAREGYDKRGTRKSDSIEADLIKIIRVMSQNPNEEDCLNMLRLLIEKEDLELFIATRPGGIYHRKVGAFKDEYGDMVVFSGSGNETQNAIATIEDWCNDESFDVYTSWGSEYEVRKAKNKNTYLKQLFSGGTKNTKVRPINAIEKEELSKFRKYSDYESCRNGAKSRLRKGKDSVENINGVKPFYYQEEAIKKWEEAGHVGMLCMATGTGKTFTALFAISSYVKAGRPVLILVPSKNLIDQWIHNISKFFSCVPILCAGGGYNWKSVKNKRIFVDNINLPRIIIATMDTAVTDDFIEFFSQAKDPVLVVDEAHRLGSESRRKIMNINFPVRLGLSATPERLFDLQGSEALKKFFGKEPVYNLPLGGKVRLSAEDTKEIPILGHFLSQYSYNFKIARLSPFEQKTWNEITLKIKKHVAKHPESITIGSGDSASNLLKLLLIQRANIVKSAVNKINIAEQVVEEEYRDNNRWIVYCQDEAQLSIIYNRLKKVNPHSSVIQYHSKMPPDELDRTLKFFENNPGIIVSIRCLDEGIDLPASDGALILASSTNPREYIQRRGRVLRKSIGKTTAKIIDVLVLPEIPEQEDDVPVSIVRNELARAFEFSKLAINSEIQYKIWKLCLEYNVNLNDSYITEMEDI